MDVDTENPSMTRIKVSAIVEEPKEKTKTKRQGSTSSSLIWNGLLTIGLIVLYHFMFAPTQIPILNDKRDRITPSLPTTGITNKPKRDYYLVSNTQGTEEIWRPSLELASRRAYDSLGLLPVPVNVEREWSKYFYSTLLWENPALIFAKSSAQIATRGIGILYNGLSESELREVDSIVNSVYLLVPRQHFLDEKLPGKGAIIFVEDKSE